MKVWAAVSMIVLAACASNSATPSEVSAAASLTALFIAVDASEVPEQQRTRLEQMASSWPNKPVRVVRIPSDLAARTAIKTSEIHGKPLTITRTSLVKRADGYSWFGTINQGDEQGSVVITVVGESVGGTLVAPDQTYALKPLGRSLSALVPIEPSRFPPDHPPTPRGPHGGLQQPAQQPRPVTASQSGLRAQASTRDALCSLPVTILVLYTPQVHVSVGDMAWFAQSAVDLFNQSLTLSEIDGSFALSGVSEVAYQGITISDDLQNLLSTSTTLGSTAHTQRDQQEADVVVLLTESSDACGKAANIHALENDGYAVVYYGCATDNISFPHEIGHLIGARHNTQVDQSNSPYKYGHGKYVKNKEYRTIMSYDCPQQNCQRVPYWSNPHVKYKQRRTGDKRRRNNARVLNENTCRVAKFRGITCPAAAWFDGSSKQAVFDGANCYLGPVPSGSSPFIFQNRYYIKYNSCKLGQNDSANCFLGDAPAGTTAFTYQGAHYHTPASAPNPCPLPGSFFDSANCFVVSAAAGGFRLGSKFYTKYNACSTGSDDTANCLIGSPPSGYGAFIYQGGFYYQ